MYMYVYMFFKSRLRQGTTCRCARRSTRSSWSSRRAHPRPRFKFGTHKTVTARFWLCLAGQPRLWRSLFARKLDTLLLVLEKGTPAAQVFGRAP